MIAASSRVQMAKAPIVRASVAVPLPSRRMVTVRAIESEGANARGAVLAMILAGSMALSAPSAQALGTQALTGPDFGIEPTKGDVKDILGFGPDADKNNGPAVMNAPNSNGGNVIDRADNSGEKFTDENNGKGSVGKSIQTLTASPFDDAGDKGTEPAENLGKGANVNLKETGSNALDILGKAVREVGRPVRSALQEGNKNFQSPVEGVRQ